MTIRKVHIKLLEKHLNDDVVDIKTSKELVNSICDEYDKKIVELKKHIWHLVGYSEALERECENYGVDIDDIIEEFGKN